MESFQCHLCARFADGLSTNGSYSRTWFDFGPEELCATDIQEGEELWFGDLDAIIDYGNLSIYGAGKN